MFIKNNELRGNCLYRISGDTDGAHFDIVLKQVNDNERARYLIASKLGIIPQGIEFIQSQFKKDPVGYIWFEGEKLLYLQPEELVNPGNFWIFSTFGKISSQA